MRSLCTFLQKTMQIMKNKIVYAVVLCVTAAVLVIASAVYFYTPQATEAYAIAADFTMKAFLEGRKSTAENTLPPQPEKSELIHDKLATGMQIELTAEAPEPKIVSKAIKAAVNSVNVVGTEEAKENKTHQIISKTSKKQKTSSKKKESKNTPKIKISDQDKKVLIRIVEAEATGEDITGKMLVANVIMNRVADEEFPDNVTDVVFQSENGKYQFSPIRDGRYWDVPISEESEEAVERVLNGEDSSQGALYFMARKYANPENVKWFDSELTWLFQHGVHEFFK